MKTDRKYEKNVCAFFFCETCERFIWRRHTKYESDVPNWTRAQDEGSWTHHRVVRMDCNEWCAAALNRGPYTCLINLKYIARCARKKTTQTPPFEFKRICESEICFVLFIYFSPSCFLSFCLFWGSALDLNIRWVKIWFYLQLAS